MMDSATSKKIKTERSSAPPKDGHTKATKREASPDITTPEKRMRVSEPHKPNKETENNLFVNMLKRTVSEAGEGPSNQSKKSSGLDDKKPAASSVSTCKVSSSNLSERCSKSNKRKASADGEQHSSKRPRSTDLTESNQDLAKFEAKYQEEDQLGEGGCGSVFAGFRREDNLPVAIKHVPKNKIPCTQLDENGKQLSSEIAIMLKLADGKTGSVGTSAAVALLDWYDLDQELIMVLERPVPCVDLFQYIQDNRGCLKERDAKIILKQLVDAAKELEDKHIFHRDIKMENILIETGSDVPRVRLIDFGLGCFFDRGSFFRTFYGTTDHVPPEWYSRCLYMAGPTTVWQVGVVLFEMLHENVQFETTRFLRKKLWIKKTLPIDCQDFLKKCLRKLPEQRPTLEQLQLHPWLR